MDELVTLSKEWGAKGLAYFVVEDQTAAASKVRSPSS